MRLYQLHYVNVEDGERVGIGWVGDEWVARHTIAQWAAHGNREVFGYAAVEITLTKEGILHVLNRFAAGTREAVDHLPQIAKRADH